MGPGNASLLLLTYKGACLTPLAAEEPELPRGAAWLNDHYQAILLEQQQELARQHLEALARQQAQQAQQAALPAPAAEAGKAAPASQDTSPTSVR